MTYLRHAGLQAAARAAHRDAVTWFEQALAALTRLREGPATLELAIDLRFDLRPSLVVLGENAHVAKCLSEADQSALRLGDDRRLASLACFWCDHFSRMSDYERAIRAGEEALAISARIGDRPVQLETNLRLAQVFQRRGEFRRAIETLRRNLALGDEKLIPEPYGRATHVAIVSRTYLAVCLADLGELGEGIQHGRDAVRLAESMPQSPDLFYALIGLGHLYVGKGDWEEAIPLLERCLPLCQNWNLKLLLPWAATSLGEAYLSAGRHADGLQMLQRAVADSEAVHGRVSHAWYLSSLARAYLRNGRVEEARPCAREALELAGERGDRRFHALALFVSGELEASSHPPNVEQAEAFFQQAIALMEDLEMHPRLGACRLARGQLYASVGRRAEARAELSAASALFRAMSMDRWLARTEIALAGLSSDTTR